MTRSSHNKTRISSYGHQHDFTAIPSVIVRFIQTLLACFLPAEKRLYSDLPIHKSIRLLQIHPGRSEEKIAVSLQIAALDDDSPPYEALSYVWLFKQGRRTILCNGHKKSIATNLFEALERLRYPDRDRLIWADALSINQEDRTEKNDQVRQMHHVYRRASRVIVWLGDDEYDEAHSAFATLCAAVNANSGEEGLVSYTTLRNSCPHMADCARPPPDLQSRRWIDVMALFSNDWWTRMWVLQEIVLARSATFVWGDAEVDWDIIRRGIAYIRSQRDISMRLEDRGFQNALIMLHLSRLKFNALKSAHPFLHLLDLSRSFEVTKAEDKVYGLLGFPTRDANVERADEVFIQPGTGCSAPHIYTEVARKLLLIERNLDVLSYTSHVTPDFEKKLNMPSWVPDWNYKAVVYPFMGFGPRNQHRAGTFRDMETIASEDPEVLCLKGVTVDEVADSLPPAPFDGRNRSEPYLHRLLDWCASHSDLRAATIAETLTGRRDASGRLLLDTTEQLAHVCAFSHGLDHQWIERHWPDEAGGLLNMARNMGNASRGSEVLWRFACYRSAFVTKGGRLGMGPGAVRRGDKVVVLWGGQTPYVLREGGGKGEWWRFVGECYVDGFMEGEAGRDLDEAKGHEKVFTLR